MDLTVGSWSIVIANLFLIVLVPAVTWLFIYSAAKRGVKQAVKELQAEGSLPCHISPPPAKQGNDQQPPHKQNRSSYPSG